MLEYHLGGRDISEVLAMSAAEAKEFFSSGSGSAIIGVDLGTTNSAVALMEGMNPRIIENSEGTDTRAIEKMR